MPSYLMWIYCLRLPVVLSGASAQMAWTSSQRIRVKLLHPHIAFGFLNELFNALVLPLLYFNFLLQLDSFCFELFLFRLIALAQHIEAFVIQLAAGVVLVDLDEQPLLCVGSLAASLV